MGITKFWDIIWDNTPFHWATVIVFLGAVICESYAVWQYFSQSHKIERAIAFLQQFKKGKNPPLSSEILTWLAEHLKINSTGKPEKKGDKFILLNYPIFLERSPRSNLRFITALCTAIGILGTFYGIQEGLQRINLDLTDSQELLAAIKNLLLGMKTAFSTSLMGLGAGTFFTLVLFGCDSLRMRKRDHLIANINQIFTTEVREGGNENAIATQLLPLQSIIQFQEKKQESSEDLKTLIQTIRSELIEPVAQQLKQNSQVVRETFLELGSISQNLGNSILTIQNFQQQTLIKLEEFADNLKKVLEPTATEIHKAVSESIRAMETQRAAFEASAETAATTFRNIREELQATLHTQAEIEQQMLQETHARMITIIEKANTAFQQQSTTLQTVGNEASNLIHSAKIELLAGLQEINSMLLSTNQTIQSELEEFQQNYHNSLHDLFYQSVNGIQAQRRAFKESIADVAATFQGIREDWQQVFQACQTQIELLFNATVENRSRRRD
ncbi:MAG: hypothetical protein N3E45_16580 [Oscillatoriaceae bacterium SKW80]|nr:hypothetical protein [Oscillatoriaceae bacterium SKYG93]MCX8122415.1 hypothetical protein [Oscillatoriaceae bacterium SKW80]MDW8452660.1 hypothetical protein [Oscillatoriaceae cyanobacterium SKYGB_i_bin93]HIK28014.1 hypothetical protein [Oscillatoriaceae cyanobacterium M7585_C2015_266]